MQTLIAPVRVEPPPIKGSRFIAVAAPASDEAAIQRAIAEASAAIPAARHHAWAARLRDGLERSHDAGEPSGTAGRPILARLVGADLVDAVVVVSRVFGGIKLGAGGLVRAYGGAASEALRLAETASVRLTSRVRVIHDYDDSAAIAAIVAANALHGEATFGARVTLTWEVPVEDEARIVAQVRDATRGRATVELASS